MNERINKLAEQAGAWDYYDIDDSFDRKMLHRFAELLVRECAGICEEHHAWTARMVGNQIKDHFGVE